MRIRLLDCVGPDCIDLNSGRMDRVILVLVQDGTYTFLALSNVRDLGWVIPGRVARLFAAPCTGVKTEPEALLLH